MGRAPWLALAAAVAAGLLVGIQNPIASLIGRRSSPLVAAFAVHAGGAALTAAVLLLRGGSPRAWRGDLVVPGLVAGGMGAMLVACVTYAIPRLGVAPAVALLVAGQFTAGLLLDHLGLLGVPVRPLDLARLAGATLILLGTWLLLRPPAAAP